MVTSAIQVWADGAGSDWDCADEVIARNKPTRTIATDGFEATRMKLHTEMATKKFPRQNRSETIKSRLSSQEALAG